MKKIVLLIDGVKFKPSFLDFVSIISGTDKSAVSVIVIDPINLDELPSLKILGGQAYVEEITLTADEKLAAQQKHNQLALLISAECMKRNLTASVVFIHPDNTKDIIHHTRYADLVISDPAISAINDSKVPSEFLLDFLGQAECPVLVAPEQYHSINEVVLAYNGSKSSVFAIKQFYYQLPEFANKAITILQITDNESNEAHLEEHKLFEEWLGLHFPKAVFIQLSGDASEELYKYFMENETDKLLVIGAFGRNFLSEFFAPSVAELVLKTVDVPVFIAHH